MNADLRLRPVTEDDLALLERLFGDPAATGEHEWRGWLDHRWLRRQWDENRMLSEDGGTLMVAHGEDTLGFVTWASDQRASSHSAGASGSPSRLNRVVTVMAPALSASSRDTCSRIRR